jgi:hypothetical protein
MKLRPAMTALTRYHRLNTLLPFWILYLAPQSESCFFPASDRAIRYIQP